MKKLLVLLLLFLCMPLAEINIYAEDDSYESEIIELKEKLDSYMMLFEMWGDMAVNPHEVDGLVLELETNRFLDFIEIEYYERELEYRRQLQVFKNDTHMQDIINDLMEELGENKQLISDIIEDFYTMVANAQEDPNDLANRNKIALPNRDISLKFAIVSVLSDIPIVMDALYQHIRYDYNFMTDNY